MRHIFYKYYGGIKNILHSYLVLNKDTQNFQSCVIIRLKFHNIELTKTKEAINQNDDSNWDQRIEVNDKFSNKDLSHHGNKKIVLHYITQTYYWWKMNTFGIFWNNFTLTYGEFKKANVKEFIKLHMK